MSCHAGLLTVGRASALTLKGCGFDSGQGHVLQLQACSLAPIGVHAGGSLYVSSPSLPLKISGKKSPQMRINNNKN